MEMERRVSDKVIYPELSYEALGAAFRVFKESGYGRHEQYYRNALFAELKHKSTRCVPEQRICVTYKDGTVGNYFIDILVEDKIVVEVKTKYRMEYVDIKQVLDYLRAGNYKLAILLYFTRNGVKYRRVLNSAHSE